MLKLVHAVVGILALGSTLAIEDKAPTDLKSLIERLDVNRDRHEKIQKLYVESNLEIITGRSAMAQEELSDLKAAQEELKRKREERKERRARVERKADTKNAEMYM